MIDCGRFNKRINIMIWGEEENEIGQTVEKLTKFKTVWAEIHPLRGKEIIQADLIEARTNYKITCRYFKGLTQSMFIVFNDTVSDKELSITSICDVDMKHRYYEIICMERVNKEQKKYS